MGKLWHLEQPGAWDGTWSLQSQHCGSEWSLSLGNDSRRQLEVLKCSDRYGFGMQLRELGLRTGLWF